MADGLVEFLNTIVYLSQLSHNQTYVGFGAPTFGFFALFLTEFGFLCGPLQILLVVRTGTTAGYKNVKNVYMFGRLITDRVVIE